MKAPRKPAARAPGRLGPLAVLPVFFGLAGRRAVLAGNSDGAAWKAELLAAAGADVAIYADAPSEEMLALLERGAAAGSLTLHARPWSIDCLDGAALAVGDFADPAMAKAFRCAAKAAGVPVNTVDKPETCDFIFGSIVNRSPLVIGISTDGAAPILGQALRRRLEAWLPAGLTAWAQTARRLRERVLTAFEPGPQRRAFWENFAEMAFSGQKPEALDVETLIASAAGRKAGRVSLVGAGPGDAELLTIKALRALQSADVILHDDLVSEAVLQLARREARRIGVGKRGARESCKQDDINALMVALAREGNHVIRLKSGDPMIFGRAGEEIAQIEAAGIAYEVVPGISTAQALAAQFGVSLTHRDHAQSLAFVTGHSREGKLATTIDWQAAASGHQTTIFYMGARVAAGIRDNLLAHGLAPSTPGIAVAALTQAGQAHWLGPIAELEAGIASLPAGAPILIGIGEVFGEARPALQSAAAQESPALQESPAAQGRVQANLNDKDPPHPAGHRQRN